MILKDYLAAGKTYIIAEMSANHGGDLETALKTVEAAKEAGADCIKTQLYTADTLTIDCSRPPFVIRNGLWAGKKLYDLYKNAYMPWEWQDAIMERCNQLEIDYLTTPFDKTAIDYACKANVGAIKIASFEMVDIPLISYAASKGKTMILSCGMCSLEEIMLAIETCQEAGNSDIVLLKCSSEYPADLEDVNLNTIPDMIERFGQPVGFSDHTLGYTAAAVACCLGAKIIEKHFCIDKAMKTADAAFSADPAEFSTLVNVIRAIEVAKGAVWYGPTQSEKESSVFRRSLFAVEDISAGELFTEKNVRSIRPGYGLAPRFYFKLLGQKASRNINRGEPIQASDLGDKM